MKGYNTQDITKPQNSKVVSKDRFWLCKDGDAKQAVFFKGTAQCNTNESITKRFKDYTSKNTGWNLEIVFIPIAYRNREF